MGNRPSKDRSSLTKKITFPDHELFGMLCGEQNAHIKLIEKRIGVTINIRGTDFTLEGGDWEIDLSERLLKQLYGLIKSNYPVYTNDVEYALRILSSDQSADLKKIFLDSVYISSKKKVITPKTLNQKGYIDGIREFDIVFSIGPAGTGKTYLAMAMAIASLVKKEVSRLVREFPLYADLIDSFKDGK